MKNVEFSRRNKNQGVHMEFSVHPPSPLNTYSYVQEEFLGFNKKILTKLAFLPQNKNDTTTQLYCTLSMYVTPKTYPARTKKLTQHHNCMVL